jgi:hypothetical protein
MTRPAAEAWVLSWRTARPVSAPPEHSYVAIPIAHAGDVAVSKALVVGDPYLMRVIARAVVRGRCLRAS